MEHSFQQVHERMLWGHFIRRPHYARPPAIRCGFPRNDHTNCHTHLNTTGNGYPQSHSYCHSLNTNSRAITHSYEYAGRLPWAGNSHTRGIPIKKAFQLRKAFFMGFTDLAEVAFYFNTRTNLINSRHSSSKKCIVTLFNSR